MNLTMIVSAISFLKKVPTWGWVLLAMIVFGVACAYVYGDYVRNQFENAPADTSITIHEHDITPAAVSGVSVGTVDTTRYARQIAGILRDLNAAEAVYKGWSTAVESLNTEIRSRDEMIAQLAAKKRGSDSTISGKLQWTFTPMTNYPRGSLEYSWLFNPLHVTDTTRTVTKYVIVPRPLAELYLHLGLWGDWQAPFLDLAGKTGTIEPGIRFTLPKLELNVVPIGALLDGRPHTVHGVSLTWFPLRESGE